MAQRYLRLKVRRPRVTFSLLRFALKSTARETHPEAPNAQKSGCLDSFPKVPKSQVERKRRK